MRAVVGQSPALARRAPELCGAASLSSIDVIAVRLWLDTTVDTRTPANVFSRFESLRGAGGTFFMLDQLQVRSSYILGAAIPIYVDACNPPSSCSTSCRCGAARKVPGRFLLLSCRRMQPTFFMLSEPTHTTAGGRPSASVGRGRGAGLGRRLRLLQRRRAAPALGWRPRRPAHLRAPARRRPRFLAREGRRQTPRMVPSHAVHLPLGALDC